MTTLETEQQARTLARTLVEDRLAACVSILSTAASIYRWEGKLCDGAEWLLWIKTSEARASELAKELAARHPYSVPEILKLGVEASQAYAAWVEGETDRG